MVLEIDSIRIQPDRFGWRLVINRQGLCSVAFPIGDAIQFHAEVERTIGRWLADGPADFHNAPDPEPDDEATQAAHDYDLMRDMERGK